MRIPLLTTILALQLLGGIAQPIPKWQTNVVTSRGPLYKRFWCAAGAIGAVVAAGAALAVPVIVTSAVHR